MNAWMIAPLVILLILSIWLVEDNAYEDCFTGRIALTGIWLVSLLALFSIISGHEPFQSWYAVALTWAFTIFFARHFYRFIVWRKTGRHSWKKADPEKTAEWKVE